MKERSKYLVSVVGPDGCGKTTQAHYISERLREEGFRACYWKSPTFDWVRDSVNISGGDTFGEDVHTDALVFAASHRMEQYLIRDIFSGQIHPRFYNDRGVSRALEGQELPADVIIGQRGIVDFYGFLMTEGMSEGEITKLLNPSNRFCGLSKM